MDKSKKFVIRHRSLDSKEENSVTMSLRISRELQKKYDDLANKSGHSRNQLMNDALKFALENLEFIE